MPLNRTVWKFLKQLKIELLYHPSIPLLGIYLDKIVIQKNTVTIMFMTILLTRAETWKQPKCPSTDDKEDVVHTHTPTMDTNQP